MRERNKYKQTSKVILKSILKSRTSDAKMMENGATMEPPNELTSRNNCPKDMQNKMLEYDIQAEHM